MNHRKNNLYKEIEEFLINDIIYLQENKKGQGMFRKKSFTFLEILIVIIIIGAVLLAALVSYKGIVERYKSTEAIIDTSAISKAEEVRKLETGSYVAAENTTQINELLHVGLNPKYYEYKVAGVTEDNFIVIAKRIGADIEQYIASGKLPPEPIVIARDKLGTAGGDYGPYLGSGGNEGTTGGGSGTGGGTSGGSGGGGGGGTGGGGFASIEHSGGGWSGLASKDGNGAIIDAGLQSAFGLLKNSTYASYAYDLIQDKQITVAFADLGETTGAQWVSGINAIQVNSSYQNGLSSAIAALIAHEATHADYTYYPDFWISTTLTRHHELTEEQLHILQDPLDSVNQEYDCFCNQMKTWVELRNDDDTNNDGWLAVYNQGEEYMRSAIKSTYAAAGQNLPDY